MPLRIAHVITGLGTGGAESMLCRLLAATDRRRFEPHVVSLLDEGTYGPQIRRLGIPVHALGIRGALSAPGAARELIRVLRQVTPHVVQAWMYHGNLAALLGVAFLGRRTPVAWNVRNSIYSLTHEKTATALLIRAGALFSSLPDAIVYCSRVSAGQHEALGFSPARRVLIANGFDTGRLRPDPAARARLRESLGLPPETILIGHVARWHPMKDHLCFARAAGRVVRALPTARFLMAGTGVDEANTEWMTCVREEGLVTRLHMLGERDDIPAVLAGLDLFCSSSFSEAFPNAVGEAMASGLPCAVTDVGDSAWIVGETGLVVPPRDPDSLGEALLRLATMVPEARRQLGESARTRVEREFSLPAAVERYQSLWEAMVG